jgi:hypothetical protein
MAKQAKRLYPIWNMGGVPSRLALEAAQTQVSQLLEQRETCWEVRAPGEAVGEDGSYYLTLLKATEAAMPRFTELGLTPVQAALAAMLAGLVLSTGIPVEEAFHSSPHRRKASVGGGLESAA